MGWLILIVVACASVAIYPRGSVRVRMGALALLIGSLALLSWQ